MNRKFELALVTAMEELSTNPDGTPKDIQRRALDILSALRGYLTEEGTTTEQNVLLRELGLMAGDSVAQRKTTYVLQVKYNGEGEWTDCGPGVTDLELFRSTVLNGLHTHPHRKWIRAIRRIVFDAQDIE